MRVLIVEPAGNLWGSERAMIDLIESLPDLDMAVCCPSRGPLRGELRKRGVRALPYFIEELHRKPRWRRLQAALGVLRAALAFRPNVIHVNQAGAYRVAALAARVLNIPLVVHLRLFEDVAYLAACKPDPRLLKAVIAVSGAIQHEMARQAALAAIPTHRIYDAYARVGAADEPRAPRRMACIGRIVRSKGLEVLIEALKSPELPTGGECLMVGGGEPGYVAALKARVPDDGHVRVEWTGFIDDVVTLLSGCGVLVFPSYSEALGRVVLEAWDAGAVPVVYAGSGGAAEVVAAARGGIVYEEQTPECLAQALATAMTLDAGEAEGLVANGRAWMEANCAVTDYGRAVSAVFAAAAAA